jgi:putative sigma-54 modulation protein
MNITITGKNYKTSERLEETIRKKLDKLGKYFADDIDATVVISKEAGRNKIEININAGGALFRTEQLSDNIYEGVDKGVDKLARQMRKFKGKLQNRYQDNRSIRFEAIPKIEDEVHDIGSIAKRKTLNLTPMSEEEAVLKMEMSEHDFFIFINEKTDLANVVYKRRDGNYGILETVY